MNKPVDLWGSEGSPEQKESPAQPFAYLNEIGYFSVAPKKKTLRSQENL